jgi:radical SAM protein with 4Fe4S-binding SPASM domain
MHSRTPLKLITKVTQTPDIFLQILGGLVRKHVSVNHDYYLKKGESSKMNMVSIKITNMCNLRCKMCGQWGETGYNLEKQSEEIKKVVPLETYKKLVDDVAGIKPIFYIWGGEPFLYPDMIPLLRHLKKNKIITTIVTNGIKLKETAKDLVDIGLDALMLSLDGPKKVHNQIRGSEECYDKLAEGIDEVLRQKKLMKKKKPYIMLLTTISKYNADYLEDIFEEAKNLHADCLVVYYSWFTTKDVGETHTRIMQKKLNCTPFAWKGYIGEFSRVNTDSLSAAVRRIKQKEYPFNHIFIPDLKEADISRYYESPKNMFGYKRCIMPWLTAELMPNGDVSLCRDYPDYKIGNITQDSIINIFNSEKAKKFRQVLKEEGGLFPICARCCGLMGW